jgi:hypothetical protein
MTIPQALTLALFCAAATAQDLTDDLMAAARKGDVAQVKALLDKGVNVNSKTSYGQTALFFACDRGHIELVKLLLERGVDVNLRDTFYQASAFSWSITKGHLEILKLLIDKVKDGPTEALNGGVQSGNAAIVNLALERKPPQAALNNALAMAQRAKKEEITELLRKAGAEVAKAPDVKIDEAILSGYAGKYQGGRGGTELEFVFSVKEGKLKGALLPQPELTYAAKDKTHFTSVEFAGVEIEFTSEGGKTTGFVLKQGSATMVFKKMEAK